MHSLLTVVVCTRDRAGLLQKCIEALLNQSVPSDRFDILIVDNASSDNTPAMIAAYAAENPTLYTFREERVGLSQARNSGITQTASEWIAYLDDDAIPHLDWAEKLLAQIESRRFDGIGGLYLPYFDNLPPPWYLDRYNSNQWMIRDETKSYTMALGDPKFSGGNCAFRRSVVQQLGGFSLALGMRDNQQGYGEEVDLQERMLRAGYRLGFDSEIRMDHHTPRHKQEPGWFIARSFANGRDISQSEALRHPVVWRRFLHTLFRGGLRLARSELRAFGTSARGMAKGSYRWQNVAIELGEPLATFLGRLSGILRGTGTPPSEGPALR